MKKDYTVYILKCSDKSYYTGLTSNLPLRIYQHQNGIYIDSYTSNKRPISLVYSANFEDVYDAIAWERRLKRWSRKKKEAVINGDWNQLPVLSRSMYRKRIDWVRLETRNAICRQGGACFDQSPPRLRPASELSMTESSPQHDIILRMSIRRHIENFSIFTCHK